MMEVRKGEGEVEVKIWECGVEVKRRIGEKEVEMGSKSGNGVWEGMVEVEGGKVNLTVGGKTKIWDFEILSAVLNQEKNQHLYSIAAVFHFIQIYL